MACPMAESLYEHDKVEWWDVCRKLRPDISWEEYERLWDEFQVDKRVGKLQ